MLTTPAVPMSVPVMFAEQVARDAGCGGVGLWGSVVDVSGVG